MLSLPKKELTQNTITREKSLSQLNSLLLQLSKPSELKLYHLTAATIGWGMNTELMYTSFVTSCPVIHTPRPHTCTLSVICLVVMVVCGAPAGSSCGRNCWTRWPVRPCGSDTCWASRWEKQGSIKRMNPSALMLVRLTHFKADTQSIGEGVDAAHSLVIKS